VLAVEGGEEQGPLRGDGGPGVQAAPAQGLVRAFISTSDGDVQAGARAEAARRDPPSAGGGRATPSRGNGSQAMRLGAPGVVGQQADRLTGGSSPTREAVGRDPPPRP